MSPKRKHSKLSNHSAAITRNFVTKLGETGETGARGGWLGGAWGGCNIFSRVSSKRLFLIPDRSA